MLCGTAAAKLFVLHDTCFLKNAKKYGGITKNGKMMFIYQAQKAFNLWHNLTPNIDDQLINYLYND